MERIKAKLYTVWCWTGCGLSTAFWATVSIFASLFSGTGRLQHFCMRRWSKDNLWLSRARVEIGGLENIDPSKPQIFAANHSGLHDILSLAAHLPIQFRWVAKKSLFNVPFMGWHMRRSGYIPIDRENPREGRAASSRLPGSSAAASMRSRFPKEPGAAPAISVNSAAARSRWRCAPAYRSFPSPSRAATASSCPRRSR